jgi:two-component system cell cycle response regulator
MKSPGLALDSAIADRIIDRLGGGPQDPAGWRAEVETLEARWGRDAYSVLLFVLTHLDMPAEKARDHWQRILHRWETLNHAVPEGVDLRVAVLQYFLRSHRKLRNPAIVEIKILRRTEGSAVVDDLTRLFNFRYFKERVALEARRADRYGTPLTLLMIDADDFKAFNDTRGHLAGNVALRRLASVFRRSLREVDVAARYGGEEFAVLLPSTPKLAALKVAEKLRQTVESARIGVEPGRTTKPLTVSIGVASLPGDAQTAIDLVDRADRALYVAKSMGKNCVKPFSDERREHVRLEAVIQGRFSAVESREHRLITRNLSEGGLLFQSREPIGTGGVVRVQLALPPKGEPVECVARVQRVVGARGGFEIGAQIVHMPRLHERRYRFFLKALKAELKARNGGEVPARDRARAPRAARRGRASTSARTRGRGAS